MRLIDADSLLVNTDKGMQGTAREYLKFYQMAVNDEPTAYDVDKVVEQLERALLNLTFHKDDNSKIWNRAIYKAVEIVKSAGIE